MIEFLHAKDGSRIFSWQGKQLCSRYQPIEEARAWTNRQMPKVLKNKSIVILGLANGFHAADLAQRVPSASIYVINDKEEFVAPSMSNLNLQASLFDVLTVESVEELKQQTKIKKIFKHSFVLLEFAPAVALNKKFYSEVKTLLLGRTRQSLDFYLECRDDEWNRVSTDLLSEKQTEKGLCMIGFKDLKKSSKTENMSSHSKGLMGILEELVR